MPARRDRDADRRQRSARDRHVRLSRHVVAADHDQRVPAVAGTLTLVQRRGRDARDSEHRRVRVDRDIRGRVARRVTPGLAIEPDAAAGHPE